MGPWRGESRCGCTVQSPCVFPDAEAKVFEFGFITRGSNLNQDRPEQLAHAGVGTGTNRGLGRGGVRLLVKQKGVLLEQYKALAKTAKAEFGAKRAVAEEVLIPNMEGLRLRILAPSPLRWQSSWGSHVQVLFQGESHVARDDGLERAS